MDHAASNFAISTSFPPQTDVSRASIVTVVIDENVVRKMSEENVIRVTSSASNDNVVRKASHENGSRMTSLLSNENVIRMPTMASSENVIRVPSSNENVIQATPTFEMATSFSVAEDVESINNDAQVR